MTAASAIRAGRRAAESLMRDTVRVERITGVTTDLNPPFGVIETFEIVYGPDVAPKHGKAKMQTDKTYETTNAVGESVRTSSRGEVHVPKGAFVAEAGMRVTVLASLDSPEMVGTVVRLAEPMPPKSIRTADRHNFSAEV